MLPGRSFATGFGSNNQEHGLNDNSGFWGVGYTIERIAQGMGAINREATLKGGGFPPTQ